MSDGSTNHASENIPQDIASEPIQSDASNSSPNREFGLLDVIEAFTAMRHEWRGQTRSSRELLRAIEHLSDNLKCLERTNERPVASVTAETTIDHETLAQAAMDTDTSLVRAREMVQLTSLRSQQSTIERLETACQPVGLKGLLARLFFASETQTAQEAVAVMRRMMASHQSMVDGLDMLSHRVMGLLAYLDIERLDTTGKQFDGTTMRAISSVDSDKLPTGYVVEQLTPCYRQNGNVVRFAEVKVSS